MSTRLTERDYQIIEFIKEFKAVTADDIAELYFANSNNKQALARRRLLKISEAKPLNIYRKDILHPNIYYFNNRPINLKHTLLITKLYVHLKTHYNILKYSREYEIKYSIGKALRCDLMTVILINNKPIPYIFEIDIKAPYNKKYDDYILNNYYKTKFPIPPTIVSISKFNTVKSNTDVKLINIDNIDNMKLE